MEHSKSRKRVFKQEPDAGLDRLLKLRKSDQLEEFEHESESYSDSSFLYRRLSDSSDEDEGNADSETAQPNNSQCSSGIGMSLLKKAGYIEGKGLGVKGQGAMEPIQTYSQKGRLGFGHHLTKSDAEFQFDSSAEIKTVEETPLWVECSLEKREFLRENLSTDWVVVQKSKWTIDDEDRYCSDSIIKELLDAKTVFDDIPQKDLNDARSRANPYETIKSHIFQNRAAMKTANIDKIYGWRLSREFDEKQRRAKNPLDSNQNDTNLHTRSNPIREQALFYFADVCAGPGGFTEYLLWRKGFYNAKGFGFTLSGKDDFKLDRFKAAASEYLETFYGPRDDGNVVDPQNLVELERYVNERTAVNGGPPGVHLVMCDGGFSVEGQENIQEILSKRLYLCQFIAGLLLCRRSTPERPHGGNFLCKLFDVFTPFSVGLVYLMYAAFQRISIHKPLTSRPANSERYIFCENLTEFGNTLIKGFLVSVNNKLNEIYRGPHPKCPNEFSDDILEIIPREVIDGDPAFLDYIIRSNESIAQRQIFYLHKYRNFHLEKGNYDFDQARLREECLKYWELISDDPTTEQDLYQREGQNAHFRAKHCPPYQTLRQYAPQSCVQSLPKRTPRFDVTVLDSQLHLVEEFRAIVLPEASEPVLLLSQGGDRLFTMKREDTNLEEFRECTLRLPANTILLVQIVEFLQENQKPNVKDENDRKKHGSSNRRIEKVGKFVYVIDAAVLNGDDVSGLGIRQRLAAAQKFCMAVNKRQVRRPVYVQRRSMDSRNRQSQSFSGFENTRFSELICADSQRLSVFAGRQSHLSLQMYQGSVLAVLPAPRSEQSQPNFLSPMSQESSSDKAPLPATSQQPMMMPCRGVRIVVDSNVQSTHCGSLISPQIVHRPISFYDHYIAGSIPLGQSSVSWLWSWEPDFQTDFSAKNIVHDSDLHPKNSSVPTLKWLQNRLKTEASF